MTLTRYLLQDQVLLVVERSNDGSKIDRFACDRTNKEDTLCGDVQRTTVNVLELIYR